MHMRFAVIAAVASACTALAQAGAPAPLSPDWYFGAKEAGQFLAGVDPTMDGHGAQFLFSRTEDPNGEAGLSQSIPAQPYLGQRVRFRARLRTRGLSNWGGLWMRIDGSDGKRLALYNSQDRPIMGSTGWQERSVVLDVPPDAAKILVGVIAAGTGQLWMEPLDVGVVGREVPVDVAMYAPFLSVAPADTMPSALAREVVNKTVELVESRGLYPREQADYDQARTELLAALDGQAGDIKRRDLYFRIQKLLWTLDVDGHSFLRPAARPSPAAQPSSSAAPSRRQGQGGALAFRLVATSHGTVLYWVPPPIEDVSETSFAAWLKGFHDEAAQHPGLEQACALVVDLSEQTGGSAWPQMAAMQPLFGAANKAKWVSRDGQRQPVVSHAQLDAMNRQYADGRASPLSAFAGGPLAVLVGEKTASAGEMLLVALMGEDRVQTFGRTSYGLSTGNMTYTLPDGSNLVLTETRYALGDGPVYHKGIAPMHPAAKGETWDASVRTAAEWAATNSPQCKAGRPAVAQAR
jgi:hypothetical protein